MQHRLHEARRRVALDELRRNFSPTVVPGMRLRARLEDRYPAKYYPAEVVALRPHPQGVQVRVEDLPWADREIWLDFEDLLPAIGVNLGASTKSWATCGGLEAYSCNVMTYSDCGGKLCQRCEGLKDAGVPAVWVEGITLEGDGSVRETLRDPALDLFR